MTIYMTKIWGFGSPASPLQFSGSGWRDSAVKRLKPGDLVILVGTQQEPTAVEEQGLVLGMMEPTSERVSSLDFVQPDLPTDYDDDGVYRWPYGLLNRRAWKFDEPRTRFVDISQRKFNMDAAQGIVPLTEVEAAKVLALPYTEVPLLSSVATIARIEGHDAARRKGAPPPTTTRRGTMHMRRAPAYTYAMAIFTADELRRSGKATPTRFKIGWAFDWKARMRTFNHAAMPALGGLEYRIKEVHLWTTATEAFRMEQALLRKFDAKMHPNNREIVSGVRADDLALEWARLIAEAQRGPK